jgi:hypothetical protein
LRVCHRLDVATTVALVATVRASFVYRQELAELAHARDWEVHVYDAKAVVGQAVRMLGERADEVLQGPRAALGPRCLL